MKTELYWIVGKWPGRIAIMPRPRGGDWLEDEVRAWRDDGVDVVVSLLEEEEVAHFELAAEAEHSRTAGMSFITFPIADRSVPSSREAARELVMSLTRVLRDGKNIAIHCRQGIGRAALIAAALLIELGIDAEVAIERVSAARGRAVPETQEQTEWLLDFARHNANPLSA